MNNLLLLLEAKRIHEAKLQAAKHARLVAALPPSPGWLARWWSRWRQPATACALVIKLAVTGLPHESILCKPGNGPIGHESLFYRWFRQRHHAARQGAPDHGPCSGW